jgi:hypothetical protein
VLWAGRWVVWAEGASQGASDERPAEIQFLRRTETWQDSPRSVAILFGAIGLYIIVLVPVWGRLATWAATIDPQADTEPVSADELRRRLFTINDLDSPLLVEEGSRRGEIVVTWKYADAHWVGLFQAMGVKRMARTRLRINERRKTVNSQDQITTVDWEALAIGRAAFKVSGFRGIVFTSFDRSIGYGLAFRDGRVVLDKTHEYRFSIDELRAPIADIVTSSGWSLRPVILFL